MEIKLYKMTDATCVVNKTLDESTVLSLEGKIREPFDIVSPIITFQVTDINDYNYLYVPSLKRYYYIKNTKNTGNNLWVVQTIEDALKTYETKIKTIKGHIVKSSHPVQYAQRPELRDDIFYKDIAYDTTPFNKDGENIMVTVTSKIPDEQVTIKTTKTNKE